MPVHGIAAETGQKEPVLNPNEQQIAPVQDGLSNAHDSGDGSEKAQAADANVKRAQARESNAQAPDATAKNSEHLVNIPIFFITDRNRELCSDKAQFVKFGNQRQYTGICNHDPHVGVAYCAIDNNRNKPITPDLEKLGWKTAHKHVEGAISVSLVDGCTYEEAKDQFYEDIYKKALATQSRDIFVFTPGYVSTFESGLKEAARFAYYAERPVLLYSWPSKGKLRAYSADEASIEWSQDHYNEMLIELAALVDRENPAKIRLLSHSMGARLALRAIPIVHDKNAFAEISFVCPDVDDGVVKHYVRHFLTKDCKTTLRLYMSHKDEMLKISQFVHGGYARFGETDGLVMAASPYKKALPSSSCNIAAEALKRFQTIDFTEMDEGPLGHKIPVHLVCDMSLTGKPPSELAIEAKQKSHADCSPVMLNIASMATDPAEDTASYFKIKMTYKAPLLHAVKEKLPVLHTFLGKDWTLK